MSSAEPAGPSSAGPPPAGSRSGSIRVFLVDDHEMLRRGVRDMLEEAGGFQVVGECSGAVDALARLPVVRPDVALIDVRLPDGSGIDVCRSVRRAEPRIRVVFLTTFDDTQVRRAAAAAGADALVAKWITGDRLVSTVRDVAAGRVVGVAPDSPPRPTPARDPRLARLTGQEQRVLALIADGLTNRQIGERLGIGENTVKNYVTGVLAKLELRHRTEAAVLGAAARGY